MNSLKTLYFPATDIYSIRQYPIFLLFQDIHIIRPVENDQASVNEEPTDTFIKSGFCQVDTPAPLGQNRDRFLHLVEDIRNRKDDYAAQLSSLTLAAMSNPAKEGESSDRDIINQLFAPENLREKTEGRDHEAKLWQARLVLAIAEILDCEEEEIAKNLAILDDETTGLYKELKGETDDLENEALFDELSRIEQKLGHADSKTMKKRLAAWKILFEESKLSDSEIFLTTSRDAGDFLINNFEKTSNKLPLFLSGLTLPGLISTQGEKAVELVNDFSSRNETLLASLHSHLHALVHSTSIEDRREQEARTFADCAGEWDQALEEMFPAEEFGRTELSVCIFSGINCSTLLGTVKDDGPLNGLLIIAD